MDSNTFTDPVCGMSITPAHAAGTSQYDGKAYYFCAPSCKASFDADPASYADPKPAAASCCMTGHCH